MTIEDIKSWQTLISGCLALLGAVVGIYFLSRQIRVYETQTNLNEAHQKNNETHRKSIAETKAMAARSVLPLTLSSIIEYTEQASSLLRQIYTYRHGENISYPSELVLSLPNIPTPAITSLQAVIETSTNHGIAIAITKIIQRMQILHARLQGILPQQDTQHRRTVTSSNVEEYVIDAGKIHSLASELFAYARFEMEDMLPVTWEHVLRGVRTLGWMGNERIEQTISRRSARPELAI